MVTSSFENAPARRQARLAGLLLLLVAASAGVATAAMHGVVAGDPAATATALANGQPHLGVAVLGFLSAFALDVAVAVVFYALLRSVNPTVAMTSAALRAVYAAAAVALLVLLIGPAAMSDGSGVGELPARALSLFGDAFTVLLTVFGLHLVLLGWLLWQSGRVPRWLAALVAAGGGAYVVHAVVLLLTPALEPTVAPALALLAFGELVLAVWLVARGLQPRAHSERVLDESGAATSTS